MLTDRPNNLDSAGSIRRHPALPRPALLEYFLDWSPSGVLRSFNENSQTLSLTYLFIYDSSDFTLSRVRLQVSRYARIDPAVTQYGHSPHIRVAIISSDHSFRQNKRPLPGKLSPTTPTLCFFCQSRDWA